MGAIADAILAYAQPLIDQTDGSTDQLNRALALAQVCYNVAMLPEKDRNEEIQSMQATFEMDDDEFVEFRQSVILPMIERHQDMFPLIHRRLGMATVHSGPSLDRYPHVTSPTEKYPGTGRYDPCPCNSGRKYKFCCGSKKGG